MGKLLPSRGRSLAAHLSDSLADLQRHSQGRSFLVFLDLFCGGLLDITKADDALPVALPDRRNRREQIRGGDIGTEPSGGHRRSEGELEGLRHQTVPGLLSCGQIAGQVLGQESGLGPGQ
jgi:hypothetical protein